LGQKLGKELAMENPFILKIFKHMSWANLELLNILSKQPDEAINYKLVDSEWTVGKIAHHIIAAQEILIARLLNEKPIRDTTIVSSASQIAELIPRCRANDAKLLELTNLAEQKHIFGKPDRQVEFATSTILAQAVHHATEHRAQISDVLAANGSNVVNLDLIDVWAFEQSETN
jgi:uncharacterized damage-inducible protein DinB